MSAGHLQNDVLERVRRRQRMHGKPSAFSGLRVVLAATAITVLFLIAAFGAIGMLLMARTPQEPIATRVDPAPPMVQQQAVAPTVEFQPEVATSTHAKTPEPEEPDHKPVKTLRIAPPAPQTAPEQSETVAPEPEPAPREGLKDKPADDRVEQAEAPQETQEPAPQTAETDTEDEPETTAAVSKTKTTAKAKARKPVRAAQKRPPRRHSYQRRVAPEPKSDNPLMQLFGIKQYR